MAGITDHLRRLHRIHEQLGELRSRMNRGPKQLQARQATLESLRQESESAKMAVRRTRLIAEQKELHLKSLDAKLTDLREKLQRAKSSREYQTLEDQIAADEMATSVLQDEILETLERVEQLQAKVPESESATATAEAEFQTLKKTVEEKVASFRGEVDRLEKQLGEIEAELPADVHDAYNRVVRQKGADALAPVQRESCSGCFNTIPTNTLLDVRLGRIVFCHTCGRLLYLPEEPTRPGG